VLLTTKVEPTAPAIFGPSRASCAYVQFMKIISLAPEVREREQEDS